MANNFYALNAKIGVLKKGILKKEENDAEYGDFEFNINQNEESLENDFKIIIFIEKIYFSGYDKTILLHS